MTRAPEERDFRVDALRLMAHAAGVVGASVLARHPDAEAVAGEPSSTNLAELLWDELDTLERRRMRLEDTHTERDRRVAVSFYVRRRVLARYAQIRRVEANLPDLWARVVRLTKEGVGAACVDLGVLMITAIIVSVGEEAQRALFQRLTKVQRQRVRACARSGRAPRHATDVIDLWFAALDVAREMRGDARADEMLGRILLASLFQRLPAEVQAEAIKSSRTTFCGVLQRTRILALDRAEDLTAAESLAAAAFGMSQDAIPDPPDETDE